MSEEKLEPCSCGGEAKVIKDVLGFWAVECKACLTRLGVSDTRKEIIEAWNDMRSKEMSEEKLRNCPFCGGEASVYEASYMYSAPQYYICCDGCGCEIPVFNTEQEAIKAWNRRYKEQDDEK